MPRAHERVLSDGRRTEATAGEHIKQARVRHELARTAVEAAANLAGLLGNAMRDDWVVPPTDFELGDIAQAIDTLGTLREHLGRWLVMTEGEKELAWEEAAPDRRWS